MFYARDVARSGAEIDMLLSAILLHLPVMTKLGCAIQAMKGMFNQIALSTAHHFMQELWQGVVLRAYFTGSITALGIAEDSFKAIHKSARRPHNSHTYRLQPYTSDSPSPTRPERIRCRKLLVHMVT